MTARQSRPTASLRIEAPVVVTGDRGEVLTDATIIVRDEIITWVGSTRAAPVPEDQNQITSIPGAVLPGLIDAHVHLAFDGGEDPVAHLLRSADDERMATMAASAASLLRSGVTTVRDLGAPDLLDVELRRRLGGAGPRLVLAGRPITSVGGHCWFLGGASASFVESRRVIDENLEAGTDVVKVMVTGGFMTAGSTPWTDQLDADHLQRIVDHAHDRGTRVAAHAHGTRGIEAAAAAGVDTIEHCMWVGPDGLEFDPAVAELIASKHIAVCATVNQNARGPGKVDWAERAGHIEDLHRRGVALIAGTDAGIARTPHERFARSLPIYTDAGLSRAEVIHAATGAAADALGLGQVVGRIHAGLRADLLVVSVDPTLDLSTLERPVGIMFGGTWVQDPAGRDAA